MKKLLVVGSINVDMFFTTNKIPNKGETVIGNDFTIYPGGKGANQAVAASRLGADVSFLGCVGDDQYGQLMIDNLAKNKVDTSLIKKVTNCNTGVACVLTANNDNSIIVIKGANELVNYDFIKAHQAEFSKYSIVLIQNEIPYSGIKAVIEICKKLNIDVIYNPAPIENFSNDLMDDIKYITPNETEVCQLSASDKIITTLGKQGVCYLEKIYPSIKVDVVDTTGAGDTFNGALCSALLKDMSIDEAISFAIKAASLTIQKQGAQAGMPTILELT